jgi:hypothetical protein
VVAFKLYPAGATTNSDSGVTDIQRVMPTLHAMAEVSRALPAATAAHRLPGCWLRRAGTLHTGFFAVRLPIELSQLVAVKGPPCHFAGMLCAGRPAAAGARGGDGPCSRLLRSGGGVH